MSFATRYGFKETKPVQLTSMDDSLRHTLWNALCELIKDLEELSRESYNYQTIAIDVIAMIWSEQLRQPSDVLEKAPYAYRKQMIRDIYYILPWHDVYELIEFVADILKGFVSKARSNFIARCNCIFERENAGYRFIDDWIVPITNKDEIACIKETLAQQDEAAQHLASALNLISDIKNDYSRESIAQAISAPEAIAKKITGHDKSSLSTLCSKAKIIPNHPQIRQALLNLYSYASDKDGIRHALTEGSQPINRNWARFMLVICSAFVNLIRAESIGQLS